MTRAALGLCVLAAACAGQGAPAPAHPRADPEAGPAYVTRAPEPLSASEAGIGAQAAFDYVDLTGQVGDLAQLCRGSRGVVVLFTSMECPVTRLYAPLLAERARGWQAQGLRVLAVAPASQDTDDELRARAAKLGWEFPVARDPGHLITAALGAERTADTFLLDPQAHLVYRGALDDQYGINYRRAAPRHRYLDDAVEALLAGRAPEVAATDAPGCLLR